MPPIPESGSCSTTGICSSTDTMRKVWTRDTIVHTPRKRIRQYRLKDVLLGYARS